MLVLVVKIVAGLYAFYIAATVIYEWTINRKGVPNLATVAQIRKEITAILQKDADARRISPYSVIDLGSGSGYLTQHIARNMPQARVLGIENNRVAYWISLARRGAIGPKNNLDYLRADFLTHDISNTDAVVMYICGSILEKISAKLRKELKPGAIVVSSSFDIPGWEPAETLVFKTPFKVKIYVYRQA